MAYHNAYLGYTQTICWINNHLRSWECKTSMWVPFECDSKWLLTQIVAWIPLKVKNFYKMVSRRIPVIYTEIDMFSIGVVQFVTIDIDMPSQRPTLMNKTSYPTDMGWWHTITLLNFPRFMNCCE